MQDTSWTKPKGFSFLYGELFATSSWLYFSVHDCAVLCSTPLYPIGMYGMGDNRFVGVTFSILERQILPYWINCGQVALLESGQAEGVHLQSIAVSADVGYLRALCFGDHQQLPASTHNFYSSFRGYRRSRYRSGGQGDGACMS